MKSIIQFAGLSSSLLSLALLAACAAKPASVTMSPISGNVFVTHDKHLRACDQAAEKCKQQPLEFKPIDAAVGPDGGLVFLTASSVYRCDDTGQNCLETRLPVKHAAGVSVAASGQIAVVSRKGEVAICSTDGCRKVAPSK